MPKIETPTSVRLYVQWILHPFQNPKVPEQESENSKWAFEQAKKFLNEYYIDKEEVQLILGHNGLTLMDIQVSEKELASGREFWEYFLSILKTCENIESISVYVNNDMSEKIAANLSDQVLSPWQTGYRGYDTTTLIYHK